MAVALKGLRGVDRREWVTALARTRETWRACFERRPEQKVEQQLELMRDGRDVPVVERPCEQCGGEIVGKIAGEVCSDGCRRAAEAERRRRASYGRERAA